MSETDKLHGGPTPPQYDGGGHPPPAAIPPQGLVPTPGAASHAEGSLHVAKGVPGAAPAPIQVVAKPYPVAGIPPGLEYLSQIDQLIVHQEMEMFEILSSWETKNKYKVNNSAGQQIYFAQEESNECQRQCNGSARGFIMHITDNLGQEVIRVTRDYKCCAGWTFCAFTDCCAMDIKVEAPIGQVIGSVRQECSFGVPTYGIFDSEGHRVLGVVGPLFFCQGICCPNDINFKVTSEDGSQVGKISKRYGGYIMEHFTQSDNFGISFPQDLDVRMKAMLMSIVFLIDFMYFEQKPDSKKKKK